MIARVRGEGEYRWKIDDTSGDSRKIVRVFADDNCYGYNDLDEFIDVSVNWCRENDLTGWVYSWLTIQFTKEQDMILFLLRWG